MEQWTWLVVRVEPDDMLVRSEVGPPGQSRETARAYVQMLLDSEPALSPIASAWRGDGVKDDTVYSGLRAWAVLAHAGDPRAAALDWIEGYAETMRSAGVDVQVARRPSGA